MQEQNGKLDNHVHLKWPTTSVPTAARGASRLPRLAFTRHALSVLDERGRIVSRSVTKLNSTSYLA